ncbi:MAG: hypothetical protein AB3N14_07955 [Flavobacteriaceae bacterium]
MRKFSLFFVAMLLSVGTLFANVDKPKNPNKTLSAQIGDLLDNNPFIVEYDDLTAKVKFTLNQDKEIVVLRVETDNEVLEAFVKNRLNYQKVDLQEYREGRTYTVPVRITE